MSVVTTQPEMLTAEPSKSNGWSLAGGSHAHRSDGAGTRLLRAFRDDTNLQLNSDLRGTVLKKPAVRRMSILLLALAIGLLGCSPAKTPDAHTTAHTTAHEDTSSPATTAQVLEAVKAAQQVQTLSDKVAASLSQPDDAGAKNCFDRLDTHNPTKAEFFGECAFGDPHATKLMVIYGDSRAVMWSAPLESIAVKNGWKLRMYGFGGCSVADIELMSWETHAPDKECDTFRSAAISQIQALHPSLVITTSVGNQLLPDGSAQPTPAQFQDAWVSTFQKLAQPGTRLAMIAPIPSWQNDDARCLAAHVRDVQACSVPAADDESKDAEAPQAAAAAAAGVVFVSPRQWVCAERCEPVIADIRVYRERYHFSRTYAMYLTGALTEALQPAMS